MIKYKVFHFIEENKLFSLNSKVLVALSGGADSVALLCLLHGMGYHCEAAHCNFHLRGTESNRDENFVRSLTDRLGINLHVVHFETEQYATRQGISIEMAARELRYDWFEKVRKETDSQVIAVAHHRDDSVETLLLNLVRGTGINGLRGIQAVNGFIVRPLLEISRKDILDYLASIHQDYVIDSTNLQDEFMRNKIRLNVIPLLETINPSVSETIQETSRRLSDVADVYHAAIEIAKARVVTGNHINIPVLLGEVAPESVLYEILYPLGYNSSQIKDVFHSLDKNSGKLFYSKEYTLLLDRDELIWKRTSESCVEPILEEKFIDDISNYQVTDDAAVACIDADLVSRPLKLRKWQSGDRFMPLGMKCNKKIRDYLRDHKYSLFEKEKQMVVCSGEKIVWLVNARIDDRFKVSSATKHVLELRIR